jgi:surface polysaccharide O-acyltransferase-like enzyme
LGTFFFYSIPGIAARQKSSEKNNNSKKFCQAQMFFFCTLILVVVVHTDLPRTTTSNKFQVSQKLTP